MSVSYYFQVFLCGSITVPFLPHTHSSFPHGLLLSTQLSPHQWQPPWLSYFNTATNPNTASPISLHWVELCSFKRYVQVLPPIPVNVTFFWKRNLCRCSQVEIRSHCIRVHPKSNDWYSCKRQRDTQKHTGTVSCNNRGRDWSDVSTNQGLRATTRSQEETRKDHPWSLQRACQHLDF